MLVDWAIVRPSRASGLGGALFAALISSATPLRAQPAKDDLKDACAASYEQAQTLRRAGKLTLARAQMLVCQQTCPTPLATDCRRWTEDLEARMPRLVVRALDREGRPLPGVELSVNGDVLDLPSGSTTLSLDPGTHRVVLRAGEERRASSVVLVERQRQELRVEFSALAPRPAEAPRSEKPQPTGIPPAAWAFGALGLAGIGVAAVLGIQGHADRAELRESCAPNCRQEEVDSIRRRWTIAAIAGAVGVVSSGLAIWIAVDGGQSSSTMVGVGGRF